MMHSNNEDVVVECELSSLSQYTGMTDKKGVRIWENDRCWVSRPCILAYGSIRYMQGCFCFVEDRTGNILRLCDIEKNGYEIKVEDERIKENDEET